MRRRFKRNDKRSLTRNAQTESSIHKQRTSSPFRRLGGYYGARYLDPTGAMWLSVDPLFEKYAGMSPYNYCAGNPVKMVDVDGRELKDIFKGAIAAINDNIMLGVGDYRSRMGRQAVDASDYNLVDLRIKKDRLTKFGKMQKIAKERLKILIQETCYIGTKVNHAMVNGIWDILKQTSIVKSIKIIWMVK